MSSDSAAPQPFQQFGLRLALWYATLFVAGAIAIVFVTYWLTATSLEQRDHQIIQQKLDEYAGVYARGGLRALTDVVTIEQRTAPESLFVRVVDRGAEARILSLREGWDQSTLQIVSLQFPDGTLVEVGKSIEARLDLLARFRAALGLVTLLIVVIALSGGWLATQSALQPIRRLAAAVQRIISTGRTDERVPVAPHDDAITELTELFNAMLDKIEGLVTGMRGALDNVSHDLRTPLTRLRGTAEMALASAPDVDRYREALADCIEESDRVLTMLNTLMDITEAESGAMPLQREPLRLAEIVRRSVELYRDVADAKGVSLPADVQSDVVVPGDRVRLEQVAANLIDNAVKYTPRGGHVGVEVGRQDGHAILRVRDTGPGIPSDELPRIWERLFRGDQSRAERGLGLGLSLVKAVVEAHGGTVSVSSEIGRGSEFVVSLPVEMLPGPNLSPL
jgi:signal transduction histidine kinase